MEGLENEEMLPRTAAHLILGPSDHHRRPAKSGTRQPKTGAAKLPRGREAH
ncbi:hypothetical protein NEUTE1DRAFT_50921 [Neurospora tetrasperma FGSC 2508]|uniref:Uncharacterized protein n=1 Tax=Neurospora tetrasperma (strain FGSC 2508 / ATCC MYA-4615 / P0657) TaxID=510951 RepID=F8MZN9_NEUT8|nr:uncharacterized protein NEUTE1DRAFT_50921 [Neurospora tetrasperma FGSC 2508]EGO53729.1 hypothetical protein NEUTE1DRAFT_50921 [Neurospora tetrasperma FGSC 2508]EGZ76194.1 hypothetical protein NEUTE2DRAFT_49984 [Neurospora tetrasperma FGSC 2509]